MCCGSSPEKLCSYGCIFVIVFYQEMSRCLSFVWCFLFLGLNGAQAGDTLFLSTVDVRKALWETGKARILYSRTDLPPDRVLSHDGWEQYTKPYSGHENGYYWIHLTVYNDLPDSVYLDLVGVKADSILLYKLSPEPMLIQVTGNYVNPRDWVFPEYPELAFVHAGPGKESSLLLRLSSHRGIAFTPDQLRLQTRGYTNQEMVDNYRKFMGRTEFNGFFLGGVCIMMIFFFFLYFWMNEKALLYYTIYLAGAASYAVVVKTLPYSELARVAYLNYELTYRLGEPIQYFFFASYAWFGKHLLDIDQRYGYLYLFLRVTAALLVMAGIILLIENIFWFDFSFQQKIFVWTRLILFPLVITMMFWTAIVVKSPVKWMFIAGSSIFILGGLLAFTVDPKSRYLFFNSDFISPVLAFKSGILLESIFFALALGYKLRAIRISKERVTSAYIEQMELNRKLTATENERLERMVRERTEEILEKNRLLEEQKQQQIKAEYEKQLSEMEMQALRSQMNPHFIFNSLNSIRHQILTRNYDNASNYLVRFARLLRKILHNSRRHVIPLSEEIDLISLYLQLEKLRFGDKFEYELHIDEYIDAEGILIPSMLLQPYVENAIKHGIAASQREKRRLNIRISETGEGFQYIIEDNGIGREAALKLRTLEKEKTGLGLRITDERIALFNSSFDQKISVLFDDLKGEDGEPMGTKVIVSHTNNIVKNAESR